MITSRHGALSENGYEKNEVQYTVNAVKSITFSLSKGLLTFSFEEVPDFSAEMGMFLFKNSPDYFVPVDDRHSVVQRCTSEALARSLTRGFVDILKEEPNIDLGAVSEMTVVD